MAGNRNNIINNYEPGKWNYLQITRKNGGQKEYFTSQPLKKNILLVWSAFLEVRNGELLKGKVG